MCNAAATYALTHQRGLIKITTVGKGQQAIAYIKYMTSAASFDRKMFLCSKVPANIDRQQNHRKRITLQQGDKKDFLTKI